MQRLLTLPLLLLAGPLCAQWTHQYPLVDGYSHHVYLEGFELPILNAGPMDPAPSPDGSSLAFSARGWLWLMDLQSGEGRRITHSSGMDSRPEWSVEGDELVFVRDSGNRLSIVSLNLTSGAERVLVDTEAINLDPVFSPDGDYVYYASSELGPLQIWRVSSSTGIREELTSSAVPQPRSIKRRPVLLDPDSLLIYLRKENTRDSIELLNLRTGTATTLAQDGITAQADIALSPDGEILAYAWPADGGWELRLLSIAAPQNSILLTRSLGMPLAPAFSHDGQWVYFAEAGDDERTALKRISIGGGAVQAVAVNTLDWDVPTGRLVIETKIDGRSAPVRLSVSDADGHPVVAETGPVRSEGQNGRVFYYSDGRIELLAPAGDITVAAVQGFETQEHTVTATVVADKTSRVTLDLTRIWDASARGWYSGDNHFHLNYGGPYRLQPDDIVPDLRGEGVDMAYPLLANLHNRFLQQELWGWSRTKSPLIEFGQEVRPHFLGHVELLGSNELFWPWIWGPGYEVYQSDDRQNATALQHARDNGGLGGYVHPVGVQDPFSEEGGESVPVGFVADAVLGDVDIIELACLWSDEIGTAALWHSVLNLGIPLAASAGSDVMNNYYRTMAIGATRVYVKPEGKLSAGSYLEALAAGRSFVSNGPMLEFTVAGAGPGNAITNGESQVAWSLDVHSALPFDSVQIIVNGAVVKTLDGSSEAGSKRFEDVVTAPDGGWITARVLGDAVRWPAMDSYLFAETSPVWFGTVGSSDAATRRQSAQKLLTVLDDAEQRLKSGYGNAPIPKLLEHFGKARVRLEELANQ